MLLKKMKSGLSGGVIGTKFYVDKDGISITILIWELQRKKNLIIGLTMEFFVINISTYKLC